MECERSKDNLSWTFVLAVVIAVFGAIWWSSRSSIRPDDGDGPVAVKSERVKPDAIDRGIVVLKEIIADDEEFRRGVAELFAGSRGAEDGELGDGRSEILGIRDFAAGRRVAEAMSGGFSIEAATILWKSDPELATLRREIIETLFTQADVVRAKDKFRRVANQLIRLNQHQADDRDFFLRNASGDVGLMAANLASDTAHAGRLSTIRPEPSRFPVFSMDEGRLLRILKERVRTLLEVDGVKARYPILVQELGAKGVPYLTEAGLDAALELLASEQTKRFGQIDATNDQTKVRDQIVADYSEFKTIFFAIARKEPHG